MYEQLKGKKLLVIGSEEVDCNIVNSAHELGVYVIVCDGNKRSDKTPAKNIADESWDINYSHITEIGDKCLANKVDGVLAGYSEFRVMSACKIAQYIGTPFYATLNQIELTRNKRKFKDECIKYGIKIPKDYCFNTPPSEKEIDKIDFPVIVKPTDYAGRKGVCVCYNKEQLIKAIGKALDYSESKTVIVEDYIIGTEFSSVYSLSNGETSLSCFNEKFLLEQQTNKSGLCELAVSSSRRLDDYISKCDPYVRNFIKGIGAENGVMFFQGIITEKDFYIFEMGYRLNGGNDYVQEELNNNISYMKMLISYSLTGNMGDDLSKDNPFFNKVYSTYIMYAKSGIVDKVICNIDTSYPGIDAVHICASKQTEFREDGTTAQRAFSFKISAKSLQETATLIKHIQKNVQLTDKDGNSLLLEDFDTNRLFS